MGVSNKWQQWMRSDGDTKKRKRENERTEKKREKDVWKGEGWGQNKRGSVKGTKKERLTEKERLEEERREQE